MVVCVLVLYGRYKTVKEQLDMINNVTFDFETIANYMCLKVMICFCNISHCETTFKKVYPER
jgi:hypothetical protein